MAVTAQLPLAEDLAVLDPGPASKRLLRTSGVFVSLKPINGLHTSLSAERLSKAFSNIMKECGINAKAHSVRAAVEQ